jgi:putative membrane protein
MQAKLALVAGLIAYHLWCAWLVRQFARKRPTRSVRWYRLFNELPALFLAGIVVLVIVRPF